MIQDFVCLEIGKSATTLTGHTLCTEYILITLDISVYICVCCPRCFSSFSCETAASSGLCVSCSLFMNHFLRVINSGNILTKFLMILTGMDYTDFFFFLKCSSDFTYSSSS